jgi:hypothetical protein
MLLIATSVAGYHAAVGSEISPPVVDVPAGSFLMGSTRLEREMAYALDEAAYGHARTREGGW